MNNERWDNLIKMIEEKFEIEEDYIEDIHPDDGGGQKDIVVFTSPLGKIKLAREVRPLVTDKKTFYSKRGQNDMTVKYNYSKDETTQSLKAYKFDDFKDEWQEINSNNINEIAG